MDNRVLFRTALGGFNKEDVVTYIEKINKDTNRMLSEKDAEIKSLSARVEDAEKLVRASEERGLELEKEQQASLEKHADEIRALNERIAALEKELAEKAAKDAASSVVTEREQVDLQKYNAVLAENASLAKQLELYKEFDGVQRDLGTIMIKAEKNAAEIVAKAKKDADETVREAARVSDEITERRITACAQIAENFDRSKSSMDEVHHILCEKLDGMKSAVDAFYSTLEMSRKIVHENVDEIKSVKYESDSGFINK